MKLKTLKITLAIHKELSTYKAAKGFKTIDETIKFLLENVKK
jgi:hypothetical protein